ncbi:MAG: ATP-binding cassette domain-containing protein [Streptosporangiales bacterium]|nr:ATP-binding cassette domain-containing protein [Streptosporangiales bacterium]
MSDQPVLEVSDLRKTYRIPGEQRAVTAVDDVSFRIPPGGTLGLVGESGSGKTTIARMLVGLTTPDSGTIAVRGTVRPLRERGRAARMRRAAEIQMVFQDPYGSLDPRLSATECVTRAMRRHGGGDRARVTALLDSVGLGSREARARPHQLSGGQRQRLAIARALAVNPALLVLDEAVAALDVSVQAQILELLADVRRESGVAQLFVSHDLAVIQHVADEIVVLHRGAVVERGRSDEVLARPEHPYTRLLLASVPRPGWDPTEVAALRDQLTATG